MDNMNNNNNHKKDSSSLFLLPSKILIAMRGTYFHEVVDSLPWYDGVLLLPPTCIKRAYQIMSHEDIVIKQNDMISLQEENKLHSERLQLSSISTAINVLKYTKKNTK
mmetsp:Transcript_34017/g.40009  ORF Transcript_34017/g.40009 Transcript_34017/m.40009 type:complete len:108 (-) Transcript_34017:1434-1757(-)